jgi:hypothetical protein
MADAPVPGYQAFWAERRASLQSEYQVLLKQYPEADTQYRLLYKTSCDTEDVAGYTPAAVGESDECTAIVSSAEDNRTSYCKARSGKVLFSALYGTYTVAFEELKSILKSSNSAGGPTTASESVKPTQEDGFKEVRRRKRHSTNEAAPTSKKPAAEAKSTPAKEVAARIFFILIELKSLLRASISAGGAATRIESVKTTQEVGFKEVSRRKRHSSEAAPTSKKPAAEAKNTPAKEVAVRSFFAPLRQTTMDTDSSGAEATILQEAVPGTAGRPPPIILTSTTNLIQLQRQLKNVPKDDFGFGNTKNGTRVITKRA